MGKWAAYNDSHSRAVFMAFKERLAPLIEKIAPDWMLHHIELIRREKWDLEHEAVEIRLVIKPIGSARVVAPDVDLRTGMKRLDFCGERDERDER